MYYEINVATKNHQHVFATARRSITDQRNLVKMYRLFQEKFPASEGYVLTVRKCYESSQTMEQAEIALIEGKFKEEV